MKCNFERESIPSHRAASWNHHRCSETFNAANLQSERGNNPLPEFTQIPAARTCSDKYQKRCINWVTHDVSLRYVSSPQPTMLTCIHLAGTFAVYVLYFDWDKHLPAAQSQGFQGTTSTVIKDRNNSDVKSITKTFCSVTINRSALSFIISSCSLRWNSVYEWWGFQKTNPVLRWYQDNAIHLFGINHRQTHLIVLHWTDLKKKIHFSKKKRKIYGPAILNVFTLAKSRIGLRKWSQTSQKRPGPWWQKNLGTAPTFRPPPQPTARPHTHTFVWIPSSSPLTSSTWALWSCWSHPPKCSWSFSAPGRSCWLQTALAWQCRRR